MTQDDLRDYLVTEAEYDVEEAENLTSRELVDAWLEWNGIIGFTGDILEVVAAAYELPTFGDKLPSNGF